MPQEQLRQGFEQALADNQIEQAPSVENINETTANQTIEVISPTEQVSPTVSNQSLTSSKSSQLTPRQLAIDDILEAGLAEIYVKLSKEDQAKLKSTGEQTVKQIDQLLDHAKSRLRQIMTLIRRFLLIIPGVNRFFLEQEVKIKTDQIIALKDK